MTSRRPRSPDVPICSASCRCDSAFREAISLALLPNGVTDLNTADQPELDKARADLLELITMNIRATINGAYAKLPGGGGTSSNGVRAGMPQAMAPATMLSCRTRNASVGMCTVTAEPCW